MLLGRSPHAVEPGVPSERPDAPCELRLGQVLTPALHVDAPQSVRRGVHETAIAHAEQGAPIELG
jgi:hypothetical protein